MRGACPAGPEEVRRIGEEIAEGSTQDTTGVTLVSRCVRRRRARRFRHAELGGATRYTRRGRHVLSVAATHRSAVPAPWLRERRAGQGHRTGQSGRWHRTVHQLPTGEGRTV